MMVEPNAKLSGSTSVACWLVEFVKVSVLSFTSGTVAGGNNETLLGMKLEVDPPPQPIAIRTIALTAHMPQTRITFTANSPSVFANSCCDKLHTFGEPGQDKTGCNPHIHRLSKFTWVVRVYSIR